MHPKARYITASVAGLLLAGTALSIQAVAAPASTTPQPQAAPDINIDAVTAHLEEFQSIADANDGNRSDGTDGYAASADYVANALTEAGYEVERQECGSCTSPDDNIIADWPGGDESTTIMLGAHLDGVPSGAGINDNGTGSAAILEVALALAAENPDMAKHVRFGWWAEEEGGLNGSAHYVDNGGAEDVEAYLNFDMIGSTNAGYFVDGHDNEYGAPIAEYLESVSLPTEPMQECCSDDASFAEAGVETTFLSTGASALKSEEQAEKWGGEAGEAFDPCYHAECDSFPDNVDTEVLNHTSDSIAYAVWALAVSA